MLLEWFLGLEMRWLTIGALRQCWLFLLGLVCRIWRRLRKFRCCGMIF